VGIQPWERDSRTQGKGKCRAKVGESAWPQPAHFERDTASTEQRRLWNLELLADLNQEWWFSATNRRKSDPETGPPDPGVGLAGEAARYCWRKIAISNNVGGVKHFSRTLTPCTPKSTISLSLRFANPTFFGAPFSHNLQVAGFFAKGRQ
jgi:hypothetical protein